MALVRFAGQLKKFVNGETELTIVAANISECINQLEIQFPGVKENMYNQDGEILESINIYVNGDNIRYLDNTATVLKEEDEIDIMSAFAAG
jgi:molybdopterin converting factor small subunit